MANCNNVRQNETCSGRELPGTNFSDAVCIHTDKIYDSCRDKDCLENIRVYLTNCGQEVVDRAINVKVTKAEVIWVFTDVELTYVTNIAFFLKLCYNKVNKTKSEVTHYEKKNSSNNADGMRGCCHGGLRQ